MQYAGIGPIGRLATKFATIISPPYKGAGYLANCTPRGYIAPSVSIYHDDFQYKENIFIGDRVIIYKAKKGGTVKIGKGSKIHRDTIIETGSGGRVIIGADTHIQPRCQFSAYLGSILIGRGVQIAPNCAFYPYNHGFLPDKKIKEQPLQTKGDIVIEDDAWIGVGAIILDGVTIGESSVIGAGSVVTESIPKSAIAVGNPARIVKMRNMPS
jgi:carbonic anhydrase/acetyltransferase-like protein (isoleucine patch superfamily)